MSNNASSRRPSAATPKYCHHAASGQACVYLDGRQAYLGPYDSPESRAEYDRVIGEYLLNGRDGKGASDDDSVSINELRLAVRQLRCLYGMKPVNDFGPLRMKSVQRVMIEAGLTRSGVNRRVSRIVRAFQWGVENEMVDPMVHHALSQVSSLKKGRTEAPEAPPVTVVDDDAVEAVLPHVSR